MKVSDNVMLARKILDAHNQRNFEEVIRDHVSDQLEIVSFASNLTLRGKDGFRKYFQMWDKAIPDGKVRATRMVAGNECVVVEAEGQGTQLGELHTPYGAFAPTGRRMTLRFCDIFQFRDGKLIGFHNYFDAGSMLSQLGLLERMTQPEEQIRRAA